MTLSKKIAIGSLLIATAMILARIGVFFSIRTIDRAAERQKIAAEFSEVALQRTLTRADYLIHPTPETKSLWLQQSQDQISLLEDHEDVFRDSRSYPTFQKILQSLRRNKTIFLQLTDAAEQGKDVSKWNNELTAEALQRNRWAGELFEQSTQDTHWAVQTLYGTVFVGTLLAFLVVIGGFVFGRRIATSLAQLTAGAQQIAGGQVGVQLPIPRDTEFGEVARTFNHMSDQLRRAHVLAEERIDQRTRELKDSNTFLDAILENIPNMVFVKDAKELRFVRFNRATEALLGYRREEMIGKNDRDFFPHEQAEAFIAKDREVLASSEIVDIPEEPIKTRSGETRWLHTYKICVRDENGAPMYLLGISQDITEQKKAMEDMHKFQQAVIGSTEAVSIVSHPGRTITYVNPAWSKLTGYAAEEVVNNNLHRDRSEKTGKPVLDAVYKAMDEGRPFVSDEFVLQRKDGSTYDAEVRMYPVSLETGEAEPQTSFFVIIQSDITERKKSERAKTAFVSLASHQLRTPLTEIRWALSALDKQKLTRDQSEMVRSAHAASKHMAETIKAMLTLSHIETGEVEPEPTDVNLADVLSEIVRLNESEKVRKKIDIDIRCPKNLSFRTDEQLLKEVLGNIIDNACKYSPQGGKISIEIKKKSDELTIVIADNGRGIPLADQRRIADKFFRASNAVQSDADGSGLGLHITYSLVHLLGGTISFVSEENTGTTFTLTFPTHHA